MTRTFESEVSEVCNLSQGIWEKGIAQGIEQGVVQGMKQGIEKGKLSSLYNLMQNMNLTLEQAMAALGIPTGERQKYLKLLDTQQLS